MSSRRQTILVFASVLSIAFATNLAFAASTRNLILFIPEALPAVAVDPANAPTLARFRHEGVNFANSHSGFPKLMRDDDDLPLTSDLNPQALIAAAGNTHATAFMGDTRSDGTEQPPGLQRLLTLTLPRFKETGRPFFLIYRLAEPAPEAPAPNQSRAAFRPNARAADAALAALEAQLKDLGLDRTTNVVIASEHGFSRVLKLSHTSRARTLLPREDTLGTLPPGFLSIDLIAAFHAEDAAFDLYDADHGPSYVDWPSGGHPIEGNGLIVADLDPSTPYARIEAHGAYGSIYLADFLSKQQRRHYANIVVEAVLEQDYLGAIFVNEKRVGPFRGALSLSHIAPGSAAMPLPDIVVAFASVDEGCAQPVMCTSVIADTTLPEGEGIANTFNRAGTATFMAARGPDFRSRTRNNAPASNADIARTIKELLSLDVDLTSQPKGRVLAEALAGDRHRSTPKARKHIFTSEHSIEAMVTEVRLQSLGSARYFDAADSSVQRKLAVANVPWWRNWHWPTFKRFTISISDDDD